MGYPGLTGPADVEDVLAALNRMAGDLQQTANQLARYLEDELAAGHPAREPGSTDQDVAAARHALTDVHDNARTLAQLLHTAETAMLALRLRG